MKPLSLQGIWWLPETPDDTETGTLTFDQIEGATLRVVGRLVPLQAGPMGEEKRFYVIHGVTTTGKPVTLLETFIVESRMGFPGIATEAWHVRTIAIGAHFSSADEEIFNRSWVRFDGIARWLSYDPFVETHHFAPFFTELTVRKPPRMQLARLIHRTGFIGVANVA